MKEKIKQLIRYHRIKAWYLKYERLLIPGTLVVGVFVDGITFATISIQSTFIILVFYAIIAGGLIAFVAHDGKHTSLRLAAPLLIQFTFGALLSATFIFYWFSGALIVSWPFIAIVVILMVGNDVFRHFYLRPIVQMSIYFFILFSLTSIILPYLFHSISPWLFLMSTFVSLGLITLYFFLLSRSVPEMRGRAMHFFAPILAIAILMNGLYFFNVIPPIPLSLREGGVYHEVTRQGSEYRLVAEKKSWWKKLTTAKTIHLVHGEPVYVFTAIFAPGELNTRIVHVWERYDEKKKRWVEHDRLSFYLTGGRGEGFRGFSFKTTAAPGRWRVSVETERGQVIGKVNFRVEPRENDLIMEEVIQ